LLIIEGVDIFDTRAVHPNAVQGALSWITLELGLSVMMTRSTLETALFISMTAKREEKFLKDIESKQQKSTLLERSSITKPNQIHHGNLSNSWRRTEIRQTVKILTAIDTIGPKTAHKLAAMELNIAKLTTLNFDKLNEIEHLSIAQAKAIYLALHSQPPMTNALVFS
jgi:ERCC4-type nuclease